MADVDGVGHGAPARASALVRAEGDRFELAALLCHRGEVERLAGDDDAARAAWDEAGAIARSLRVGPDAEVNRAVARVASRA